jgi:hypothetical protein
MLGLLFGPSDVVAGLEAVQCVGEDGFDLEQGVGCFLRCLVRGVGDRAQRRADNADRMDQVPLLLAHCARESRTSRGPRSHRLGTS